MQLVFQANMGGISVSPITQPHPKEEPNMISAIKCYLRHILTLCLTIAIIFMIACTVFMIVLIANRNIRIHRIKEDEEREV